MALLFDANSEEISHGSDASLDDLSAITVLMWVYKSAVGNGDRLWQKGYLGAHGMAHYAAFWSTNLTCEWTRATTNLSVVGTLTNFANWGTGKWCYIAFVHDTGGADADQKLLVGDLDSLAAEPSSYATQQVGAGTVDSDAAADLVACNRGGGVGDLDGYCAFFAVFDTNLTDAQIRQQQFNIRAPIVAANCVLFCNYFGTGTQADWSGNGNNGTVTGATAAPHVPLQLGRPMIWVPYVISAGDVTVTPAAVTAVSASVAPTVVHGSVTVAPSAITAVATSVNPTVIAGAVTVTPAAVTAVAASVAPTVVHGSVTVAPSAITGVSSSVIGAVIAGAVTVTPAAGTAVAASVAPTVVHGSVTVAPSAITAVAASIAPTVDVDDNYLVEIQHESDLSEYTSTVTDGGDLSQAGAAALGGTAGGLSCLIDDTNPIYGEKTFTQITATSYRFRFYIDPNSLTMGASEAFVVCQVLDSGNMRAEVILRYDGSNYELRARVYDDNGVSQALGNYDITDGEHWVEMLVTYASGPSANDGVMTLWCDDVQQGTDTSLDLYTRTKPDRVRLGAIEDLDSGTSGTLYLDELVLRDSAAAIGAVSGSVTITPGVVTAIGASVAPTVVLSSTSVTPAAITAVATSINPGVVLGTISITPASISAVVVSVLGAVQGGTAVPVMMAHYRRRRI